MKMNLRMLAVAGLSMVCVAVSGMTPAESGTIGSAGFVGAGTGNAQPNTTNPNNDNTISASPNTVTIEKTFSSVNPIDGTFTVTNSGIGVPGVTEYFFSETVTNDTGVAWTDFHLILGYETGENFVVSGLDDLLDFDTCSSLGCVAQDPTPTSNGFVTLIHGINAIDWQGGLIPDGGSVTFTFSVDVPDASACSGATPACPTVDGGYLFTLREVPSTEAPPPTVPLPGTLLLLGAGALTLGAIVRRRPKD